MRRVILESPCRADNALDYRDNMTYAQGCLLDSLRKGEAPIASHLLHTQVLNDHHPEERRLGVEAGLAWLPVSDAMVVYIDRGISPGMEAAIEAAEKAGIPVEKRSLNMGNG